MIKATVAVALVLTCAGPAAAQFVSGNKLFDMCEARKPFALGYAVAVSDWVITEMESKACIPSTVTSGQMHDIICGYLTKHPDRRHSPAHFLATQALIDAFPCNK